MRKQRFQRTRACWWFTAVLLASFLVFTVAPAVNAQEGGSSMDTTTITLPEAQFRGLTLEEALKERRSIRRYSDRNMTQIELGQLLFSGQGLTGSIRGRNLRTAPSAGATYPMELYAVVNSVEGIEPGIYRYIPASHGLELMKQGSFGRSLRDACLGQEWVEKAAVNMVITTVPRRITSRYGERSAGYIYVEAGHIGQNILLQATSLGLGGVPIGAYNDSDVNRIMSLDGEEEQVVYIITVGTM